MLKKSIVITGDSDDDDGRFEYYVPLIPIYTTDRKGVSKLMVRKVPDININDFPLFETERILSKKQAKR